MSDVVLLEEELDTAPVVAEPIEVERVESQAEIAVEPAAEELYVPQPTQVADQRAAVLAAVQTARELPPGVRQRLQTLVQQAVTLDVAGEPLLATRQVIELLAQGLPSVLRYDAPAEIVRPQHPVGDGFFALAGEDLSDQQAEQIARLQLQRAGMLRST